MEKIFGKSFRNLRVAVIVAGITVLGLTCLIFKPQIKAVMAANHLLPEAENLTELYFENHTILPETIQLNSIYSFSFSVHNLENKTVEYPYIVYFRSDIRKKELYQGKFTINNNELITIKKFFSLPENVRTQVVVELQGRNQQISFWMEPSL